MEQINTALPFPPFLSSVSYTELLLNRSALLFYYFMSVIGFLAVLSSRLSNPSRFSFVLASGIITMVAFLGGPLGLGDLLPDRFLAYSQILLSIFSAIGIISLCSCFRQKTGKYVVLIFLIAILSFLQTTSPHANRESPIYSHNTSYRTSITWSELQAAETISSAYEGRVVIDVPYNHAFEDFDAELLRESPTDYLMRKNFEEFDGLIVVRDYCTRYVFYGPLKLDYDLQQLLEQQGFSIVYNSGTVSAFQPLDRPSPER